MPTASPNETKVRSSAASVVGVNASSDDGNPFDVISELMSPNVYRKKLTKIQQTASRKPREI